MAMKPSDHDDGAAKDTNRDGIDLSSSSMPPVDQQQQASEGSNMGKPATIRSAIGEGMNGFSELVNDNMTAFRYGTVASIALLTAYGLANTPLFFRYKTVADIPAQLFTNRKTIPARLVKVVENDQAGQPIIAYVRHLSPVGSVLSRSWLDFFLTSSPTSNAIGHGNPRELIKVEIAGISSPPFYSSTSRHQRGDWLRELAKNNTRVSCELLGRRVVKIQGDKMPSITDHAAPAKMPKRDVSAVLPELGDSSPDSNNYNNKEDQSALTKLYFRPSMMQLFSTDVAASMVRYGRACVNSEMFLKNEWTMNTKILHASSRLQDMRKDIQYLEKLGSLEYEAAKKSYGMWSDAHVRETRRDVMDEVEFQTKASIWRKVWRWLRS